MNLVFIVSSKIHTPTIQAMIHDTRYKTMKPNGRETCIQTVFCDEFVNIA